MKSSVCRLSRIIKVTQDIRASSSVCSLCGELAGKCKLAGKGAFKQRIEAVSDSLESYGQCSEVTVTHQEQISDQWQGVTCWSGPDFVLFCAAQCKQSTFPNHARPDHQSSQHETT